MTRIQFIIVTSLSSLVTLCLLLTIFLVHSVQIQQIELLKRQHALQQGQLCATRLQQLATRIAQVSQQAQDQDLKDLMTREGITVASKNESSAPASSSAPTH